jgi:hypothetical protein
MLFCLSFYVRSRRDKNNDNRKARREHPMGAKWFGAAVKRKEDPALLAGRGRFVDDVRLPGT